MKGSLTQILVWTLAISPIFFIKKSTRLSLLLFSGVISVAAVSLWIANAWFGIRIAENSSTSLDGSFFIYREGAPFQKGDLIAYRWHGGATYPAGTIFVKRVVGTPGDYVRRSGQSFWVEDYYVGAAKPYSQAGIPLTPSAQGFIAKDSYFVATPHPNSLDSRYALSGNIKREAIIGRAHVIF